MVKLYIELYNLKEPSSFTMYGWIMLSLIVQYSSLLASKKPGPCLSPSVVDHPLRPTKDRRLGKLLNYQLPNLPQDHSKMKRHILIMTKFYHFLTLFSMQFILWDLLTRSLLGFPIQLACVRPTCSVHPEPGSNSHLYIKISRTIVSLSKLLK